MNNGDGASKNQTRFLQLTDKRSSMNGLGTPGPGVTVAGERHAPAGAYDAVGSRVATERLASRGARGRPDGGVPARLDRASGAVADIVQGDRVAFDADFRRPENI